MNPLSKESFLEYVSSEGCEGQSRIAIPRSTLVRWMVEEYDRSSPGLPRVPPWGVTFGALQYACEALSKHMQDVKVQISYRETKYVQLSADERELLRAGVPLGAEQDAFAFFAAGSLEESAFLDDGIWVALKAEFESLAAKLERLPAPLDRRLLGAYAGGEGSIWEFNGAAGPELRDECSDICGRAGRSLGCPAHKNLLFFWLNSLREYLAARGSDRLCPKGSEEAIILAVPQGSVGYCSWLASEARQFQQAGGISRFVRKKEDRAPSAPGAPARRRRPGPKPNLTRADEIVAALSGIDCDRDWKEQEQLENICKLLDEREIPYPKRWLRHADSWSDMLVVGRERVVKAVERAQKLRANSV